MIKNGLGIFSQFLISVHYDSWNDKANKDRAEELVDVPVIPLMIIHVLYWINLEIS